MINRIARNSRYDIIIIRKLIEYLRNLKKEEKDILMKEKSKKTGVRSKKEGFIRYMKRTWQLYVLLLPAVIYLLVIVYKPMGGILIAFQDYSLRKGIWGSKWVGLENFKRLFNSYWFPIALKNTLGISILALVASFPIPIILALAVNELQDGFFKKLVQTVSYAPHFISTVVICGMLTIFLNPEYGIVNHILTALGGSSVYFLAKPELFKWVYVVSGVWQNAGWDAVIYFAALSGVDKELLEAAEIDGANRLQRIRYINLPVLMPTILIMLILTCGSVLNVGYEKIYLLQNDLNLSASEVLSTYIYKVGLVDNDFSFSTAANLFNSVVNGIILVTVNKLAGKAGDSSLW